MITFIGTLPRLNDALPPNSFFLKEEVEDFLWKLKLSNPNLIFVLSDHFKNEEPSESFKFFVGENNKYLKDLSLFNQLIQTIQDEYQVDKIVCELADDDIDLSPYDSFLDRFIKFFPDTNLIFIQYPPASHSDYAILGRLLGELAEKEQFKIGLVSTGHLSKSGEPGKLSFDRRSKEMDDLFIEQLKTDVFSVFNMNFYNSRTESFGDGQYLQTVQSSRQSLYEGILVGVAALSTAVQKAPYKRKQEIEVLSSSLVSGTCQLLSILFRETESLAVDPEKKYSLEEYVNLLIQSKILKAELNLEDIKLDLPPKFKSKGIFLGLFVKGEQYGCFGDPELEIDPYNIKQALDISVFNLLNSRTKRIRFSDIPHVTISTFFSKSGFGIFKITTLQDLIDYNIIGVKTSSGEQYFILQDKDIKTFLGISQDFKNEWKDAKFFGLK